MAKKTEEWTLGPVGKAIALIIGFAIVYYLLIPQLVGIASSFSTPNNDKSCHFDYDCAYDEYCGSTSKKCIKLDCYKYGYDLYPQNHRCESYSSYNPPIVYYSYCGDGDCNTDESCSSCPQDCGSCENEIPTCPLGTELRLYPFDYKNEQYVAWFCLSRERALNYALNNPNLYGIPQDYQKYVTYRDPDITDIAEILRNETQRLGIAGTDEEINFVVEFIHSLPWTSDLIIGFDDYHKYPLETLYDQQGDCEDTSYLTASILRAMNYDVILLVLPNHMSVGVACIGCYGTYYSHNGRKYYFLETTGEEWKLGEVPTEFKGMSATPYPI